ncbi:MAG: lmo0937 family membrane protein [Bacteroidales bacterium]
MLRNNLISWNLYYYITSIILSIIWAIVFFAFQFGIYIHLLLVIAIISLILSVLHDRLPIIRKKKKMTIKK